MYEIDEIITIDGRQYKLSSYGPLTIEEKIRIIIKIRGRSIISMASCPVCGSREGLELAYTNVVCWGCRALLNQTPFGIELIMKDAAERFPEMLQWWDRRNDLTEEEIERFGFI